MGTGKPFLLSIIVNSNPLGMVSLYNDECMEGSYMKGILFFDIDGTLVNSQSTEKIAPAVSEALLKAKNNGWCCYISSGRNIGGIDGYMGYMDGAVFCDGAGIWVKDKEPVLFPIREELLKELEEQVLGTYKGTLILWGTHYFYASTEAYDYWMNLSEERLKERGEDSEEDMVHKYLRHLDERGSDPILELDVTLPDADMERIFIQNKNHGIEYVSTFASYGRDLQTAGEVTAAGVTKGSGARRLADMLGIRIEDTFAFGDSMNDASILQACGTGVCMGNGAEELKQIADYVTGDIQDNGLIDAMKHFGIIE